MKLLPLWSAALLLSAVSSAAVEHISVIGDSLSKEYQVTFPGIHFPLFGIEIEGIDELNPGARNWTEILHVRRNAHFDLGVFRNSVFSDMYSDTRLLGHEYNWAVPGATSRALRLLLTDPNSSELLNDPDIGTLLAFAGDYKDVPQRLTWQLRDTSSAAVIWCGGNDLRFGNTDPFTTVDNVKIRYQTIYEGDGVTGSSNPAPLMNSILNNIKTIAEFTRAANPTLPIVVVAVPHIGCAPTVKAAWPTDPVRTQRITNAVQGLNNELKTWTENTLGGAFVDVFPTTVALISGSPDIGCVQIANTSDTQGAGAPQSAHNRFIFSHDGFHPITPFQGRVAQLVQLSLQEKWPDVFGASPPLMERELLTDVLGIPARTGFDEFMAASGAPAGLRGEGADADGDGMGNLLEFALAGNHPWLDPRPALPVPAFITAPVPSFTLTWAAACERNIFAGIVCQQSANLSAWTDVPAGQITTNLDGTVTARVPGTGGVPAFLRLRVTAQP
jgi:hypothetical protein